MEVPPSPNVHAHEVGRPAERSVNWTVRGARPAVGVAVKAVTGGEVVSLAEDNEEPAVSKERSANVKQAANA